MTYAIIHIGGPVAPELNFPYICNNPKEADECVTKFREYFPQATFSILRDGFEIEVEELQPDLKSNEIQTVRVGQCFLPASFRTGRFGESDLATDASGQRHGVWKPPNPEDQSY